jgi:hypothetical protein
MGNIIVSSTTDSNEAINEAALAGSAAENVNLLQSAEESLPTPATEEVNEGEGEHLKVTQGKRGGRNSFEAAADWVGKSGSKVASTTDSEESVQQVQEDLDEDREAKKEEYLGGPKSRQKLLRQIDRMTAQKHRDRQEKEELRQRLSQYEGRTQQQQQQPSGEAQQPTPEQQQLSPEDEAAEKRRLYEENRLHREQDARRKYADFDQVMNTEGVELPQVVLDVCRKAPDGYDVAYYLGTHPAIARQILEAWNQGQQDWVGRKLDSIADRLRDEPYNPREAAAYNSHRRVAPPPPPPMSPVGATARAGGVDPGQMNMKDYKAWYKRTFGGG